MAKAIVVAIKQRWWSPYKINALWWSFLNDLFDAKTCKQQTCVGYFLSFIFSNSVWAPDWMLCEMWWLLHCSWWSSLHLWNIWMDNTLNGGCGIIPEIADRCGSSVPMEYLISASLSEEGTLYTDKNGALQPDFGCSTNKANFSIENGDCIQEDVLRCLIVWEWYRDRPKGFGHKDLRWGCKPMVL